MPGWPAMGPAADPLPGPRLALVVATATYTADPGLRQLRAPARDAVDLAQVLADPGIGDFAVTTVIDQTAHQIRLAVEDFLDGRGTGDLLLVYMSCHGLLDARRRLYFAATWQAPGPSQRCQDPLETRVGVPRGVPVGA